MSEPFIAEIRIFAGNFAPRNWAFCNGQLLPISQNPPLFSLIGTTYGGDGRSTMALPDLQGRAPMHPGQGPGLTNRRLGEKVGAEDVTLLESQMPSHNHTVLASGAAGVAGAPTTNSTFARNGFGDALYQTNTTQNIVNLASEAVSHAGGAQAHPNMQPYLALNFIIALQGVYPSRS